MQNRPTTAYVVLGGGVEPDGTSSPLTAERARVASCLGSGLLKQGGPLPFFVFTGGRGYRKPPVIRTRIYPIPDVPESEKPFEDILTEANIMEETSIDRLYPPQLVLREAYSQSTILNGFFTVLLVINPLGIEDVRLVTHDWHQERALLCFRSALEFLGWSHTIKLSAIQHPELTHSKLPASLAAAEKEAERRERIGEALLSCRTREHYLELIYFGSCDLSLGRFDPASEHQYKPKPPTQQGK